MLNRSEPVIYRVTFWVTESPQKVTKFLARVKGANPNHLA